jgi:hypothetical protein
MPHQTAIKRNRTARRVRSYRGVVALLAVSAAAILQPATAATPVSHPLQLAYFSAQVSGAYQWELTCNATDPARVGDALIGTGARYADDWMAGTMEVVGHQSAAGHVIQVGDSSIVFEPRTDHQYPGRPGWKLYGSEGGPGAQMAYVAWASWGSTLDCSAEVGGSSTTVHVIDPSSAFYAGPEALGGGVYYQDGPRHISAVRFIEHSALGGPVFAALSPGLEGQGHFVTDNPYRNAPIEECHSPGGSSCVLTRPRVTRLDVALTASYEGSGGTQGELWVIGLPPDAP